MPNESGKAIQEYKKIIDENARLKLQNIVTPDIYKSYMDATKEFINKTKPKNLTIVLNGKDYGPAQFEIKYDSGMISVDAYTDNSK